MGDGGRSHRATVLLCTVGDRRGAANCNVLQSTPKLSLSSLEPIGVDAVPPSQGAVGRSCCFSSTGMHECVPTPRPPPRLTLFPPCTEPCSPTASIPISPHGSQVDSCRIEAIEGHHHGYSPQQAEGTLPGLHPHPKLGAVVPYSPGSICGCSAGGDAPTNSLLPPSFGSPAWPAPQPCNLDRD